MKQICVLGSINMDLVLAVDRIPTVGETVFGHRLEKFPGGKGANQAVAASRLGQKVAFIGRIGNDENGRILRDLFLNEGMDLSQLVIDDREPTGIAMISVDSSGGNNIIVISGANNAIDTRQVAQAADLIRSSDILVSQFEVPVNSVIEAFSIARSGGVTTVLNPSPAAVISDALYRLTDVIIPNEYEAGYLTGIPVTTPEDAYLAGQALLEKGVKTVIITLGSQGAAYKTADFQGFVPAHKVTAIDTTAAGDSFLGAVCSKLDTRHLTEANLAESVAFANRVAAIVVTRKGAQSSLPYLREL